jgi:hypothetical protein
MKRIILALAAITLAFSMSTTTASAQKFKGRTDKPAFTKTAASDSKITFIGRTQVNGNDVSFDWTGTYARIKFNGLFYLSEYQIPRKIITMSGWIRQWTRHLTK